MQYHLLLDWMRADSDLQVARKQKWIVIRFLIQPVDHNDFVTLLAPLRFLGEPVFLRFHITTDFYINYTVIINEVSRQETQALQVFGRCSGQGHDFSNSLVETLVRSVPQEVGQVTVSHLVLVVTHLMVHCEEVVHVDLGAHFDPDEIRGKALLSAVTICETVVA